MIDLDRLVQDFKAELGARFIYYLTTGVVIVFLTRQLPPDEYGRLFLIISILAVYRLFSSLGLAKSSAKHIAGYLDSDPAQARQTVHSSLKYNVVTITVVASLLYLFSEPIASFLDDPALEPLLILGVLYIVFATLYNYTRVVLQGFRKITSSAFVYAIEGVGRLIGVLVFVAIGLGTIGAFLGYVFGFAVAMVIGFVMLHAQLSELPPTHTVDPGLKRRLLRYSVPLTVTRGAWVFDREVDTILVGIFLNPAIVGFYAISKQVVTFCTGPAGSIGFAIGPQFSEEGVAEDAAGAARVYKQMLSSVMVFYLPATTGLLILAGPLVTTLFGSAYEGAVPILQVFCGAIVLIAITETTEDLLDYLGLASARARIKGVTSVGNVVLTVLFIQAFGAVGAAAATVIMQAVYTIFCLYFIHLAIPVEKWGLVWDGINTVGVTIVMAGFIMLLVQFITGVLLVLVTIPFGIVIWGVLSIRTGLIDPDSVRSIFSSEEGEN